MATLAAFTPLVQQQILAAHVTPADPKNTLSLDDELFLKIGGQAQLYFGGDPPRSELRKPLIIAGPFPGDMEHELLYKMLNTGGLLGLLRKTHGYDVVLVRFLTNAGELQTLAATLQDFSQELQLCIRKVNNAVVSNGGDSRLVVAGVSMGGLVARHALTAMEKRGEDHRTAIFLSWDSPHRGAMLAPPIWGTLCLAAIPIAITRSNVFAYLASQYTSQMLFHRFRGGEEATTTASDIHGAFMEELWSMGGHPRHVAARYAVANGAATGALLSQYGQLLFDTSGTIGLRLTAEGLASWEPSVVRANVPVLLTHRFEVELPELWTGAPGGAGGFIEEFVKALKPLGVSATTTGVRNCFIPTRSALDVVDDGSLHRPINLADSNFDDVICGTNSDHCEMEPALVQFVLGKLAAPFPAGPSKTVRRPRFFHAGRVRALARGNYVHFLNQGIETVEVWLKGPLDYKKWTDLPPANGTGVPYQPALQTTVYEYEFWHKRTYAGTIPCSALPDDTRLMIFRSPGRDLLCLAVYPNGWLPEAVEPVTRAPEGKLQFYILNELPRQVRVWVKNALRNDEYVLEQNFFALYEPYSYSADFNFEFWSGGTYLGTLGGQSLRAGNRKIRIYEQNGTRVLAGETFP